MEWMLIAAMVFGNSTTDHMEEIEVDLLEINTLHDKACRPIWCQVIAWQRWHEDGGRLHNIGWRMVSTKPWELPVRHGNRWTMTVIENNRVARISAGQLRVSSTQNDPERDDSRRWWRDNVPENVFSPRIAELPAGDER